MGYEIKSAFGTEVQFIRIDKKVARVDILFFSN